MTVGCSSGAAPASVTVRTRPSPHAEVRRLRKSRRLIGAARGGREFSPREFGDRGARDLLFLG